MCCITAKHRCCWQPSNRPVGVRCECPGPAKGRSASYVGGRCSGSGMPKAVAAFFHGFEMDGHADYSPQRHVVPVSAAGAAQQVPVVSDADREGFERFGSAARRGRLQLGR